ncbi:MAG: IS3 family transposase [Vicinamibacterales bacterium]
MRKSKFSETQIVGILKDAESGVPVAELLRKHGVSKATFFKWRSKYGGASVSDVKRLRELEAENAKLKRMYADLALENTAIKDGVEPKVVRPSARRQVVEALVQDHQLPVLRACRVVRLSRTAYYEPPVAASRRDAPVIAALTDAVTRYPRWGFWKLFDRLRTEGRSWNHKRVHRVYCALRLNLPRRTTRRVPRRIRQPLTAPPVLNHTWALDFMTETLYDGRRVRLFPVLDEGNREGLDIAMGVSLPSRRIVRVLNELVALHGPPAAVRVDNGPEFTAQPFVDWAAEHRVVILYIQPGKPDQNAYIERFNRSYRTEVLNAHLFESLAELRAATDAWLQIYNRERPHDSLGRVPPLTFLPRPTTAGQSLFELST